MAKPKTTKKTQTTKPKRKPPWQKKFLAHLALTANVAVSAKQAKIGGSHVYRVRQQDPEFAAAWRDALREAYDHLELVLIERLRDGEEADGEKKRRYENGTALRLLTLHRDMVMRERGRRQMADEQAIYASIRAKIALIQARDAAFKEMVAEEKAASTSH